MNRKDIFIKQLAYTYNENGWFVSFENAVKGLTDENVSWKPNDSANSIQEIIVHLNFWNRRYLNLFEGNGVKAFEGTNDVTFSSEGTKSWEEAADEFRSIMKRWTAALQESTEEKLDSPISENREDPWHTALTNLTIHNAYHIGQIITIRKQQGSWNPENGVH